MWRLLLKKLGMSILTMIVFILGIFGWGLTLYPFNFPYLLQLSPDADYVIAFVFALLFTCVVTVTVRGKWCFENDVFFSKKEKRFRALLCRIVTSQDFIADVAVFALWDFAVSLRIGLGTHVPWFRVAVGVAVLVVGGTLAFGLLDCLLYVIARKRADRKLRKLQRKREE